MNDRLTQDLWDWEEGRLSSDELAQRHPSEDIPSLLLLYGALSSVPADIDADRVWDVIDSRISDRPLPLFQRLAALLKRPVIALAASTLMSTGVAYAADVGPVRDGVDKVLGGIVRVFGGNDDRKNEQDKNDVRGPGDPGTSSSPSGPAEDSDDDSNENSGSGSDDDSGSGSDGEPDGDDDSSGKGSDDDEAEPDDDGDDDSGSGSDGEPDGDDDSSGKGSDDDEAEPDDDGGDDSPGGSSNDEDEIDDPNDEADGGAHEDDLEDLIDDEAGPGDSDGDDD